MLNKPWLIQRGTIEKRERKGIDGLVSLDYMGSAEFEFGAVPGSLKRIRANLSRYTYSDYPIAPNKTIVLFCKPPVLEHLETVKELAAGKMRLKERSEFPEWITGASRFSTANFWWDIENDFMFWDASEKQFTEDFKKAI